MQNKPNCFSMQSITGRIVNISYTLFLSSEEKVNIINNICINYISKLRLTAILVFLGLMCFVNSWGQATYPTAGTYTYTVPAGITQIKVECWGAGGGGGSSSNPTAVAGGAGGGAYAKSIVTVIPGNTYSVVVGAGGTAGNAGGNSTFNTNTVIAAGGSGVAANTAAGGTGGTTAASVGTVKNAGGNGGTVSGGNSGGGGGGAGSNGAGGNASGTTAGTGTSLNGGDGGTGRIGNNNGRVGNNYGGGGSGAKGNGFTGGTGAGGYVVISLPSVISISSPSQITATYIFQGTTVNPVFSFNTAISTSDASLNTVSFTTSGTYIATDISNFRLWYNTANDLTTASQIGIISTSLGVGSHSFSGLTQSTSSGSTGYYWITADISNTAIVGATISVNAINTTDLSYEIATISGNTTSGGIQTIAATPNITLSSSNPAVSAASLNQAAVNKQVYAFTTAITNANATLNSVSFSTTGTATGADLVKFKLWYNTSNNFASSVQIGSDIISGLSAGVHSFTGLSTTTNSGSTGYFWITADITSFPTDGNTIIVSAITTSDLSYSLAIKSGTTYAGGTQTISVVNGILLTSTYPAVSATSILQGSVKQRIYKFATVITGSGATINSVSFITSGTYAAADITNFKLWYASVNSLVSATQIGSTLTSSLGTGTHTFSGLSQVTAAGNTGYFWITADIAAAATPGRTLTVNAITTADLSYASGSKSGSAFAGGIQTIQLNVDADADGTSDLYDLDDDNDGIPDITENNPCNTSAIELFPNSNFSAGNTGFASAYTYAAPAGNNTLYPEGLYTIVTNPNSIHNLFAACGDHTTSSGNMMVVNGDPTANKIVWSSGNIAVTPHTDYTLSLYLASVTTSNPAQLIWNVNGENIGTQFNATTTNCQWVNAVALWNSGNNTTATFDIVNLNLIASGNDFALDDISCKYKINCDADNDAVFDKLDIDSDNDGIYDVIEAGGTDVNLDGIIDSYTTDTDHDGLADAVDNQDAGSGAGEVTSGTPLTNPDSDSDSTPNMLDTDSDGDLCYDSKEAGFTDGDNDGRLGTSPVTVNITNGKVTSASGYTTPSDLDGNGTRDYVQRIPYITGQPANANICLLSTTSASFAVTAVNTNGTYQWQVSTDKGLNWTNVSGAAAATLNLTGITAAYDSNQYRCLLYNPAYICSPLTSNAGTLRAFANVPSQPGAISGYSTICPAVSSIYSSTSVTKALSYTWSVPAGWSITAGAGTTSITATSSATSGNVSINASNTCGSGTSRTLAVTVNTPAPTFTTPTGATVCQAVDVTYTTEIGKSNYVWSVTTGSLGADYTITSGGSSTDNTFTLKWLTTGSKTVTVNYTSGGCSGTAVSKTLTVNANAMILTQPVSPAAMCAGSGSVTIGITASGTISGYQWQVSTDGGGSWSNISNGSTYNNVTTNTLTISNPPVGLNNAQYHCLVSGSCGTVTSNAATLTVNATSITGQSTATQTQCQNGTFSPISVTATGPGLTYQWYRNNSASTSGGTSLGSANGAQTSSYTPQSTTIGTLYYYCIVTGTCGSATSAVSGAFNTTQPTAINSQSTTTQTQCVGGTYTAISVTAIGTGTLTYQWYRNIVSSNSGGTSIGGANSASYTPSSATAGTIYYYCVVHSDCGSDVTSAISGAFITNAATTITGQSTVTQTQCIGGTLTPITVTATGTGTLTFQWYSNTSASTSGGTSLGSSNGAQTSSYTPQATTAGTLYYYCIVTGTCGTATSSVSGAFITNAATTITGQSTATQTQCIGGTFTAITVTATGTGTLTYQWYSNTSASTTGGTSLGSSNGAQTSSYTPQATTAGTLYYYCIVSGTCGNVTSNISGAFITNAATTITGQSTATQTQCIGGTFTAITVTATGTGTLTYQWYRNTSASTSGGTSLGSANGAQTSSYTPQATTAGTLYYYCIVTGTCGNATSTISGAFITNAATTITGQSTATQTQCIGGTFTAITVTAAGTGTLTYQWYRNTSASTSGGTSLGSANGAQTSSYTPQATTAGTLYYYCIVTGTCGNATSTISGAFITNAATTITGQSTATQTQCIGGTFSAITVTATGTGTLTYQWYSNTSASTTGGTSLGSSNGAQTSSYTPQATTAGTLYYYCIVTGTCGTATSSVSGAFITNAATTITGQSTATQTQCIGGTFTAITVSATGTGTLTYQWYSNTSASTSGGTSLGSANGAQTSSYTPQAATAGTLYYYCIVTGTCGTATSSVSGAFITNAATTITGQSTATQTQCIGGTFTAITVTAAGTGTLTYQWYSNTSASTSGGTSLGSSNGAQTSSYTPQATTAGTLYYYCIVTGTCGTATSTISGAFITNAATTITGQSTATQTQCIGGTYTPITVTTTGTGTLTYQWYRNTSASTSGGTSMGSANGAQTSSYTPQATTAGTLYYYCIVTGTCGTATSSVSGAFITNAATTITGQSTATQTQCIGGTFTAITVTAAGTGTLTYQWYSNTSASTSGGTSLGSANGAQTNSYTPQATTAGTLYYYCIVSGTCGNVTSTISGAFITNAATTITGQSTATQTQCIGGTFSAITVTATGTGTLTYQWYSNTSASTSGGTSLGSANGAQTSSYTPQAATAGTLYYYCIVSGTCGNATSSVSGAFITNAATTITGQSTATQTQCIGGTFSAITVTATGTGTLTYQWYRNTSASTSGGTSMGSANGAQTSSYTPQATAAGTLYYYCIVTGTCGTATSSVSGAFITNAATTITGQSTATQTQCIGGTFSAITVTATGTGTLTYQWYSNTSASTSGGTSLGSANGAQTSSYTPQAATAGTLYYYCIVSGTCGNATSSVSGAFITNAATTITGQSTATQTQCIGGTFSAITVTATGTGTLTYQWYRNTSASTSGGTSMGSANGAQTSSYTPQATAAGTLYYYCIVTATCGTATSSVSGAFITNAATTITGQSTATQTQCIGGTFSGITVTATGTGTLTYQWYSNTSASTSGGTSLGSANGAQTSSYTPQATTAGTLYYYCIVSGTCGNATSTISGAFITNAATTITGQSTATQTQCIGGTFLAITVTATGTGTLTYQWYSNTSASTSGGTSLGSSNGAQTSSYTPQAATAGTLYYYCIVSGTCGNATSSVSGAFITNAATTITGQSTATQTQCIGGTFTAITVTATGTGILTYQWYSNTSASTTGGTSLGSANGAQTSSYTPQATTAGTLYYYCIVTGTCGTATSTISGAFITNAATTITGQSTATQTQCIGGTFTAITITATGTGTLTYQWYSNTSASTSGGTSLGSANGAQTSSYTPQAASAGTLYYYCIVTGTCGNATSSVSGAFITNAATTITGQSTATQTQCIGGTFTAITVTATGTGTLTYQWYSNTSASTTGGTSLGSANGAQTNSYTLQATTAGTLYYYCIVTGTCGTATSSVSGAFITNAATTITGQSTATQTQCIGGTFTAITVTATGTGTLTYQWYSNTSASTSGGTSLGSANGAQTSSYTPQAASAGTLYYYCIVTGTCGNATSSVSGAFITNAATTITGQSTATQNQCIGGTFTPITVTATGTGTLTYQWYSNTSASSIGGISLGAANGAQTDTYTPLSTSAGTKYYYCIVTGLCGSANNLSFTPITTIADNTPPSITGTIPVITVMGCSTSDAPAAVSTTADLEALGLIITDGCSSDIDLIVNNIDSSAGGCPIVLIRTYKVKDASNNESSYKQYINIADTTKPTASNPAPIVTDCLTNIPAANPLVVTDEADNCSMPTVTFVTDNSDGNSCPEITTRIYRVADACNNSINVAQTITIDDNADPTLTLPAIAPVQCIGDIPAPYADYNALIAAGGSASDNCGIDAVSFTLVSEVSNGASCPEIITRTYRIGDNCNNQVTENQNITINDNTLPALNLPVIPDIQCGTVIPVSYTDYTDLAAAGGSANDNCGINSSTFTLINETNVLSGKQTVTTRTYQISDNCGNTTNTNQIIRLGDNTPPQITCPTDIEQCAENNTGSVINNIALVAVSDNCSATENLTVQYSISGNTINTGLNDASGNLFNNGISAITYTVIDENSNQSTCNFNVNINPIPLTSEITGNDKPDCEAVGIGYSVTNTTGSKYQWAVPTNTTIVSDTTGFEKNSILVNYGKINGDITVTEISAFGCVGSEKSISVELQGCSLAYSFTSDKSEICFGDSITFWNTSTGVPPSATYAWNFGTEAVPSSAAGPGPHTVRFLTSGTKTINLTINNGGNNVVSNNILVDELPNIYLTGSDLCGEGNAIFTGVAANSNLVEFSIDGGTSTVSTDNSEPYEYSYHLNTSQSITAWARAINSVGGCSSSWSGGFTITALASDQTGNINIESPENPGDHGTYFDVACRGETRTYSIDPKAGSTFHWTIPDLNIDVQGVTSINAFWNLAKGSYPIRVQETTSLGCSNIIREETVFISETLLDLGDDQEICKGQSHIFSPSNEFSTYTWNDLSHDRSYTGTTSEIIWLKVSNEFGCEDSDTVKLVVNEAVPINLGKDTAICGEIGYELSVSGYETYNWSTGESTNSIIVNSGQGQVILTATDNNDCSVSDTIVILECNVERLFEEITNTFTPNNDGLHDTWIINNIDLFPHVVIDVFDRNGRCVFHTEGYSNDWAGTYNGKELPMDTYYYVIDFKSDKIGPRKGTVTIVR